MHKAFVLARGYFLLASKNSFVLRTEKNVGNPEGHHPGRHNNASGNGPPQGIGFGEIPNRQNAGDNANDDANDQNGE
jgi:hypothetical protein